MKESISSPQNSSAQFMPAHRDRCPDTSYKTTYLPALIAGMVTLAGVSLNRQHTMLTTLYGPNPIGILNTDGICYLAACIQMLDAINHAKGEAFRCAITPGPDIIGAYHTWRNDESSVRYIQSQLTGDPQHIIDAWVTHNPHEYLKKAVIKKISTGKETVKKIIIPAYYTNGTGGRPEEALCHILETYSARCKHNGLHNIFKTIQEAMQLPEKQREICIIPYRAVASGGGKPLQFDPDRSIDGAITSAPDIMVLTDPAMNPHTVPLYCSITTTDQTIHTYRLLSAIYCLPIQQRDAIYGHAIAIARYNNRWYHCDNQYITPIGSGDDLSTRDWILEQACTTYEGEGFPFDTVEPLHVPHGICYEKIRTDTLSDRPAQKRSQHAPYYKRKKCK